MGIRKKIESANKKIQKPKEDNEQLNNWMDDNSKWTTFSRMFRSSTGI